MKLERWSNHPSAGSTQWAWRARFRRLQLQLIVYRHSSSALPDRWVFQPSATYDRQVKEAA